MYEGDSQHGCTRKPASALNDLAYRAEENMAINTNNCYTEYFFFHQNPNTGALGY